MKAWCLGATFALASCMAPTRIVAAEKCASPDGRLTAWVEPTPKILVSTGAGEAEATKLWIQDSRSGNRRLLLRGHGACEMRDAIAGIENLCFSPDCRRLFFSSAAWATSPAVHVIDLDSARVSFVADGSLRTVVRGGQYAGCLLIERALIKFDRRGESLGRDLFAWLFTVDGFAILEIGRADDPGTERFIREQLGIAVPVRSE